MTEDFGFTFDFFFEILIYRFELHHIAALSDLQVITNSVYTRNLALATTSHPLLYLIRVTGVGEAGKHSIQVYRSPVTIIGHTQTAKITIFP